MTNKYNSEYLKYIDRYIERLEREVKSLKNENGRLNNIIKEAKEYIESYMPNYDFDKTNLIKLLGILKGDKK